MARPRHLNDSFDFDTNRQPMTAAPQDNATQRRDIPEVPAPRHGNMIRAGKHVIGGIQLHPTKWWSKHRHPRVGRSPAHEGSGVLGDLAYVATHIPGGQAASTQTRDHEVRKVLAYATATF